MPDTINLDIPLDSAERIRREDAARSCECPRCGRMHHRLAASPPEAIASQAMKAVEALRTPDASMRTVANTVRQSIADVIEAQKRQIDRYGLALMMIRGGCESPQELAAKTLHKNVSDPR
jgi:hypothetical protein